MYRILVNLICILLSIFYFVSCENSTEPGNMNLIANAGDDQTTVAGSYAIFDPTQSTGNFNWFEWTQDENNPAEVNLYSGTGIPGDRKQKSTIAFTKEGIYKFILIVRSGVSTTNFNGTAASKPDTLTITVKPNPYSRFEDPNLEAIIRVKLNKQMEYLDNNTLLNLDSLSGADFIPPQDISSLKGLENCKNLTCLHLGLQNLSDISPLAELKKLKVLWLDQNDKISDITPIANLTELEYLNLNTNLITELSPFKKLIKLKFLDLSFNPINNISGLEDMTELKELWISWADINDLSPLSKLNKLEVLRILKSNIEDISYLKNLSNVKTLDLNWNKIQDIAPLSSMKSLENLSLMENKIQDISPLNGLKNLINISLSENDIQDISPLRNLKNLEYISLSNNKITDLKPLVDNLNFGKGDMLVIYPNPLNGKSLNEYIPALKDRGVYVEW